MRITIDNPAYEELETLRYAHSGDAGVDLRAKHAAVLYPNDRAFIDTGVSIELAEDQVGYVMSRSGLAKNYGVYVLNAPGVVDSGYRGTIGVTLFNSDFDSTFRVQPGDRIAQLVVQKFERVEFERVASLSETPRGAAGFGSTGFRSSGSGVMFSPGTVDTSAASAELSEHAKALKKFRTIQGGR